MHIGGNNSKFLFKNTSFWIKICTNYCIFYSFRFIYANIGCNGKQSDGEIYNRCSFKAALDGWFNRWWCICSKNQDDEAIPRRYWRYNTWAGWKTGFWLSVIFSLFLVIFDFSCFPWISYQKKISVNCVLNHHNNFFSQKNFQFLS